MGCKKIYICEQSYSFPPSWPQPTIHHVFSGTRQQAVHKPYGLHPIYSIINHVAYVYLSQSWSELCIYYPMKSGIEFSLYFPALADGNLWLLCLTLARSPPTAGSGSGQRNAKPAMPCTASLNLTRTFICWGLCRVPWIQSLDLILRRITPRERPCTTIYLTTASASQGSCIGSSFIFLFQPLILCFPLVLCIKARFVAVALAVSHQFMNILIFEYLFLWGLNWMVASEEYVNVSRCWFRLQEETWVICKSLDHDPNRASFPLTCSDASTSEADRMPQPW